MWQCWDSPWKWLCSTLSLAGNQRILLLEIYYNRLNYSVEYPSIGRKMIYNVLRHNCRKNCKKIVHKYFWQFLISFFIYPQNLPKFLKFYIFYILYIVIKSFFITFLLLWHNFWIRFTTHKVLFLLFLTLWRMSNMQWYVTKCSSYLRPPMPLVSQN